MTTSSSSTPLVTIAVAVRNSAATLDAMMQSVLAQHYFNWQLLLLDDGSTDSTGDIAQAYADPRIEYYADGFQRGLAARLNQAIDTAQGQYLARLDADDIAYPDRLAKQVAFLQQHPEVDLVGSAALLFRASGECVGVLDVETEHSALVRQAWRGFRIPHPSWLGKLAWFKRHRYATAMRRAQDQELLLRTAHCSRFACLAEPLIGYRLAESAWSKRLHSRVYLLRCLLTYAYRQRQYAKLPRIVLEQLAKGSFDMGQGLPLLGQYLSHPAGRPATAQEHEAWRQLAAQFNLTTVG